MAEFRKGTCDMYLTTTVTLQDVNGNEDDYHVGAEVDYQSPGNGWHGQYYIGEPDISAPGGWLKSSRLAPYPYNGGVLADGWSAAVEEALVECYLAVCNDDTDPDEYDMYDVGDNYNTSDEEC
jgi:hypothetical protein